MKDLVKIFLPSILISLVIVTLLLVFVRSIESQQCEILEAKNPSREFRVFGYECNVLYHDIWVEVERFTAFIE